MTGLRTFGIILAHFGSLAIEVFLKRSSRSSKEEQEPSSGSFKQDVQHYLENPSSSLGPGTVSFWLEVRVLSGMPICDWSMVKQTSRNPPKIQFRVRFPMDQP